eukprot:SAG31_NODE_2923_length_4906_cov_2.144581_2_plen_69_part_00
MTCDELRAEIVRLDPEIGSLKNVALATPAYLEGNAYASDLTGTAWDATLLTWDWDTKRTLGLYRTSAP